MATVRTQFGALGAVVATALMLAWAPAAHAFVSVGISVGLPGVTVVAPGYVTAPAYVQQAPVYYAPPVSYVQPVPAYVSAPPVYYYSRPAYVSAPVFVGGWGYRGGHGGWHGRERGERSDWRGGHR